VAAAEEITITNHLDTFKLNGFHFNGLFSAFYLVRLPFQRSVLLWPLPFRLYFRPPFQRSVLLWPFTPSPVLAF
jgi:hypothetical protein